MSKQLKAMMDQMDALTPKEGYNLVGLDDYEEPGDQLFLIGHYKTHARALAAQSDHNRRNKDVKTYIYGPPEKKESVQGSMKKLIRRS